MVPNEEEFNMAYSHRDGSHQPVEMLKNNLHDSHGALHPQLEWDQHCIGFLQVLNP